MSNNQQPIEGLENVWRHQLVTTVTLTSADLAAQNAKLLRTVRRSLLLEYGASVIVILWAGLSLIYQPGGWLTKASYVAMIAGVLWVVRGLHSHLGARATGAAPADCLSFQRRSLEGLRDSLRTAWRWYLLPFVPALVLMMIDRWFFQHAAGRSIEHDRAIIALASAVCVLILVAIALWHQLVAARLQRTIDYLNVFRKEPAD